MSTSARRAAVLIATTCALALSGCSSGATTTPSSSAAGTRASRPTDLLQAHAVYLAQDPSSTRWQSYPRLYSALLADGSAHPLLPDGVATDVVEASADGGVLVYDTWTPVRRGVTEASVDRAWWWSDSTGTHAVAAMPTDVMSLAVSGDGRSVVVVSGARTSGSVPSVVRLDLTTGRSRPLCQGCVPGQKPGYVAHASLALSADGALLATSSWATDLASGFYGSRHSSPTHEQVLSLPAATVRWSSDTGFCTPVTVDLDGTLVRSCAAQEALPTTLTEVTGVLGPSPSDRRTGLPGDQSGPLGRGWWYAARSGGATGPITIRSTPDLTAGTSSVVGRWPAGPQVEAIRLVEVTHIDWTGPTPS